MSGDGEKKSLFGAPATGSGDEVPTSLFGATASNAEKPTTSIFGGGAKPAAPSTGFTFGAPASAGSGTSSPSFVFGSAKGGNSPALSPAVFGSKNDSASTPTNANLSGAKPAQPDSTPSGQKNLFSLNSTTPAVPPPTQSTGSGFNFGPAAGVGKSLFGAPLSATSSGNSTPGTSIFANQKSAPTTNIFAKAADNASSDADKTPKAPASMTSNASQSSAPVFFGNLVGGTLGNGTPSTAAPAQQKPSLFGNVPQPQSGNLFGGTKPAESTTPKPAGGLFSAPSSEGQQKDAEAAKPTEQPKSLFGGLSNTTPTGGLFGGSKPTATLFGGQGAKESDAAKSSESAKPATSLFGQQPAAKSGAGLFKTPEQPASQAQQSKSLLGQSPLPTQPAATYPKLSGQLSDDSGDKGEKPAEKPAEKPKSLFDQTSKPAESEPKPAAANLFGGPTRSGSAPSGGGLFGGLNKPSEAPKATGTSLFGGKEADKSAGTNLFGAPPKPAEKPAGNLFGGLDKPAEKPVADKGKEATPAASTSLFGGNDAAKKDATPAGQSLFGGLGAKDKDTPKETTEKSNLFAAKPSDTDKPTPSIEKSTETKKPDAATTDAAKPGATTTNAASVAGPPPPPQSRLKNKTMDEILTRWASDLSKYQTTFREQAAKISGWDQLLVENGQKIQKMYLQTFEADRASCEVERQLAIVEGNQEELGGWLDRYEADVDELLKAAGADGGNVPGGPDAERERTYATAGRVSDALEMMGQDLTAMIEEINGQSRVLMQGGDGKSEDAGVEDPLSLVVRVLNSHLMQLQDIDQKTAMLQKKVEEAKREREVAARGVNGVRMGRFGNSRGREGEGEYEGFMRSYHGGSVRARR